MSTVQTACTDQGKLSCRDDDVVAWCRTCKALLDKLKREQETTLRTRQYQSSSCPICMDDFAPDRASGGKASGEAGPSKASRKPSKEGEPCYHEGEALPSLLSLSPLFANLVCSCPLAVHFSRRPRLVTSSNCNTRSVLASAQLHYTERRCMFTADCVIELCDQSLVHSTGIAPAGS